jgi:hypothetical protein
MRSESRKTKTKLEQPKCIHARCSISAKGTLNRSLHFLTTRNTLEREKYFKLIVVDVTAHAAAVHIQTIDEYTDVYS